MKQATEINYLVTVLFLVTNGIVCTKMLRQHNIRKIASEQLWLYWLLLTYLFACINFLNLSCALPSCYWKVVMPMIIPAVLFGALVYFINLWKQVVKQRKYIALFYLIGYLPAMLTVFQSLAKANFDMLHGYEKNFLICMAYPYFTLFETVFLTLKKDKDIEQMTHARRIKKAAKRDKINSLNCQNQEKENDRQSQHIQQSTDA